jgi:hypothetical protein
VTNRMSSVYSRTIMLITAIGVLSSTKAQIPDIRCRGILESSLIKRGIISPSTEHFRAITELLCNHRSGIPPLGIGLPLGFPIHGIPVQFGGDLDGKASTLWFDRNCSTEDASKKAKAVYGRSVDPIQEEYIAAQLVPADVADHWCACVAHGAFDISEYTKRAFNIKNDLVILSAELNEPLVKLTLKWNPRSGDTAPPKVRSLLVFGADCPASDNPFAIGAVLGAETELTCKRRADMPMAFVVETSEGPAATHVSRIERLSLNMPRITSLTIPQNSQDAACGHSWNVSFPLRDAANECLGRLVFPEFFPNLDLIASDHKFIGPQIPDPERARVNYKFDRSATVTELEVIQHDNGMSAVEGFAGDSESDMASVGKATVDPGCHVIQFFEAQHCIFPFPNPRPGKFFRMVMLETNSPKGYAIYRIYPRNADHQRYPVLK